MDDEQPRPRRIGWWGRNEVEELKYREARQRFKVHVAHCRLCAVGRNRPDRPARLCSLGEDLRRVVECRAAPGRVPEPRASATTEG